MMLSLGIAARSAKKWLGKSSNGMALVSDVLADETTLCPIRLMSVLKGSTEPLSPRAIRSQTACCKPSTAREACEV